MAMITAHSGCDHTEDNSLEFIRYALNSGTDCLEVDVRRDARGELTLSHDEARGKNVSLREAFALLWKRPDKKINCDLKLKGLEAPVYRLAQEMKVERQLIYSGEVNPALLSEEKERTFPRAEVYFNIENLYPRVYEEPDGWYRRERLRTALEMAVRCGVECVNMEYHLMTDDTLEMLEELKLKGSAWTVNETDEIERLLKSAQVANVTTRNLKGALQVKEEMERV